jgi:hypothetical protein
MDSYRDRGLFGHSGPCSKCGSSIYDAGYAPFRHIDGEPVCHQCQLDDREDAFVCDWCGLLDSATGWANGTTRERVCHSCVFWLEKIETPIKGRAIINGTHYVAHPRSGSPSDVLGFGGREHTIYWFDGRTMSTNDLWYQGEIPERFRDRLPDDAEFVRTEP